MSGSIDFSGERLTVLSGATLRFYISSPSLYTRLTGIGDFVMEGDLVVALRDGASGLAVGKEFRLWEAESADINIGKLSLPTLTEGLYWDITDLALSGILRITDDADLSVKDIPNASAKVVRTEYFDLSGQPLAAPLRGLYIVRRHYADGSVQTRKESINQ